MAKKHYGESMAAWEDKNDEKLDNIAARRALTQSTPNVASQKYQSAEREEAKMSGVSSSCQVKLDVGVTHIQAKPEVKDDKPYKIWTQPNGQVTYCVLPTIKRSTEIQENITTSDDTNQKDKDDTDIESE